MSRLIPVLALACLLAACTEPDRAIEAAEAVGLKDVRTTGYRAFGCSDGDAFHTGFTAVNQNGKPVSGVVCSSYFKGATVRFD